jgi:hypothetical protein
MTDVATGFSTERLYNAVAAQSSAANVTVSAVAFLDTGPFAWSSTFQRPRFYSSPLLTTFDQCYKAALSILARSVAFSRQVSPQAIPNPALDVGDIVTVTLPADYNGRVLSEKRVLSRITFPLDPAGEMALDTRVEIDASVTADVGSLS